MQHPPCSHRPTEYCPRSIAHEVSPLCARPPAAIPAAQRARGWSDARAFSHTQLVKNPNAYFYRHVAPHEQQVGGVPRPSFNGAHAPRAAVVCPSIAKASGFSPRRLRLEQPCLNPRVRRPLPPQAQGEWIEEEHQAFVETARAHGVGDKWGLFASHLPQRVGYQCSAYYRCVGGNGLGCLRACACERASDAAHGGTV